MDSNVASSMMDASMAEAGITLEPPKVETPDVVPPVVETPKAVEQPPKAAVEPAGAAPVVQPIVQPEKSFLLDEEQPESPPSATKPAEEKPKRVVPLGVLTGERHKANEKIARIEAENAELKRQLSEKSVAPVTVPEIDDIDDTPLVDIESKKAFASKIFNAASAHAKKVVAEVLSEREEVVAAQQEHSERVTRIVKSETETRVKLKAIGQDYDATIKQAFELGLMLPIDRDQSLLTANPALSLYATAKSRLAGLPQELLGIANPTSPKPDNQGGEPPKAPEEKHEETPDEFFSGIFVKKGPPK